MPEKQSIIITPADFPEGHARSFATVMQRENPVFGHTESTDTIGGDYSGSFLKYLIEDDVNRPDELRRYDAAHNFSRYLLSIIPGDTQPSDGVQLDYIVGLPDAEEEIGQLRKVLYETYSLIDRECEYMRILDSANGKNTQSSRKHGDELHVPLDVTIWTNNYESSYDQRKWIRTLDAVVPYDLDKAYIRRGVPKPALGSVLQPGERVHEQKVSISYPTVHLDELLIVTNAMHGLSSFQPKLTDEQQAQYSEATERAHEATREAEQEMYEMYGSFQADIRAGEGDTSCVVELSWYLTRDFYDSIG